MLNINNKMEYEEAQRLGHQAVPFRDGQIYYGLPGNERIEDACKKLHPKDSENNGTEYLRKQKFSKIRICIEADEMARRVLDDLDRKRINMRGFL